MPPANPEHAHRRGPVVGDRKITREKLADLLARRTLDLVRIASPSGKEDKVADHVQRFLEQHSFPHFVHRHGRAVTAGYGSDTPRLVLVGHMDTVPKAGHPTPTIRDDQVVGLGATDMKGALAVMMTLGEGLGSRGGLGLGLVFYDCEETSFERNGLRPMFEAEPWLKKADLALILEPTDNVVELGCLGTLHARVVFTGTAAHSARPWAGENAIHKGAPFLTLLTEIPEREVPQGPVVFREVIGATLASGGSTRNVIPDRFELNVNLRFAPDRTQHEAEVYLRSLLPPEASAEIVDIAPAAPARLDSPHLRRLVDNQEILVRAKQAWTDVAQFAEHGVASANFGPGIPELAHQREERVPVENLVRCHEMLQRLLTDRERGARSGA